MSSPAKFSLRHQVRNAHRLSLQIAFHVLIRPHARFSGEQYELPKKGLITDLDDTMWSGILGEVGVDKIIGPSNTTARCTACISNFFPPSPAPAC